MRKRNGYKDLFPGRAASLGKGRSSRDELSKLWSLRILWNLKGFKGMSGYPHNMTVDGNILDAAGMAELENKEIPLDEFKEILKKEIDEKEKFGTVVEGCMKDNLDNLADLLGLSEIDKQVLGFTIILNSNNGLDETADALGDLTSDRLQYALSVILNCPEQDIADALSEKGALSRTGLLRVDRESFTMMKGKLELQTGFVDVMFESHGDVISLLKEYFHESAKTSLSATDFKYLKLDYEIFRDLLLQGRKQNIQGVNVLLYGPPGTGKTELARLMVRVTGAIGFEISCNQENRRGEAGQDRIRAYQLSQNVLEKKKNALLIFDEIEDVFENDESMFSGKRRSAKSRKAWTNRLLEENPVPAIWISNSIECMDPAYLRRFNFALKLDVPPQYVREKILKSHLKDVGVSMPWIRNAAADNRISPAMIASAAKVVLAIGKGEQLERERALNQILNNSLLSMGQSAIKEKKTREMLSYCLDALNPDQDILPILKGLEYSQQLRMCLYGPPGTGKTEFGRYVANRLKKKLIVKRASDLLGSYVGITERNIAEMFQEAKSDNSILMLDEADSFLRKRQGAKHTWEVTQVNELLTQMEMYDGLFICSTNLMDELDDASLRRFDFKIKLNYLKNDQAWLLFCQTIRDRKGSLPKGRNTWKVKLKHLKNLTPGDFALALRQNILTNNPLTPDGLYENLARESSLKRDGMQPSGIGFIATH